MAVFITVLAGYLAHIFHSFVSTTPQVVKGGIDQVYIGGRDNNFCLTQSLIEMIPFDSSKISTGGMGGYSYQSKGLIVSRFDIFLRFEICLFFITPAFFSTVSIHLSDTGGRLEGRLRLGLNSLIKHFVSRVRFPMLTIHLGLDGRL